MVPELFNKFFIYKNDWNSFVPHCIFAFPTIECFEISNLVVGPMNEIMPIKHAEDAIRVHPIAKGKVSFVWSIVASGKVSGIEVGGSMPFVDGVFPVVHGSYKKVGTHFCIYGFTVLFSPPSFPLGLRWTPLDLSQTCKWSPTGVQSSPVHLAIRKSSPVHSAIRVQSSPVHLDIKKSSLSIIYIYLNILFWFILYNTCPN